MKIYAPHPDVPGQVVYAHTAAGIQAAENQRMGAWNSTIQDYEEQVIDWTCVYDASPELADLLDRGSYYDGDVQRALCSIYIDSAGIAHARSLAH